MDYQKIEDMLNEVDYFIRTPAKGFPRSFYSSSNTSEIVNKFRISGKQLFTKDGAIEILNSNGILFIFNCFINNSDDPSDAVDIIEYNNTSYLCIFTSVIREFIGRKTLDPIIKKLDTFEVLKSICKKILVCNTTPNSMYQNSLLYNDTSTAYYTTKYAYLIMAIWLFNNIFGEEITEFFYEKPNQLILRQANSVFKNAVPLTMLTVDITKGLSEFIHYCTTLTFENIFSKYALTEYLIKIFETL